MIAVARTERGWVEFDWVQGVRCSSVCSEHRNYDELAAERKKRLEELKGQLQSLHLEMEKKFEEMAEEERILNEAIADELEILDDLLEIGQPFSRKPR